MALNKHKLSITERFLSSLDTYSKGFDGRNISAMFVIVTAVAIGWSYGISLIIGKEDFDFNGVLLVTVLLLFGAVYLAIISGEQLKEIMTSKNTTTIIDNRDESKNDEPEEGEEELTAGGKVVK